MKSTRFFSHFQISIPNRFSRWVAALLNCVTEKAIYSLQQLSLNRSGKKQDHCFPQSHRTILEVLERKKSNKIQCTHKAPVWIVNLKIFCALAQFYSDSFKFCTYNAPILKLTIHKTTQLFSFQYVFDRRSYNRSLSKSGSLHLHRLHLWTDIG